jgi:glycosyltransferase involved in cell wall biosynthesis
VSDGGHAGLVSVGIPTYNRPSLLERAVRSVLAQDHSELELIVSDDASPDPEVAAVLERLAAEDPRVRVTRQPRNLGHARNYQWVLDAANGAYFMWLSDDDWLDPSYISRCLSALLSDSGLALVCGQALYARGDGASGPPERVISLDSRSAARRVIGHFARVGRNGALFGIARTDDVRALGFEAGFAGDWMLVAGLAARGRVHTLTDVHVHRSVEGIGSAAPARFAASLGMGGLAARAPHLVFAARLWRRIASGGRGFESIRPAARVLAATVSAALVIGRFSVLMSAVSLWRSRR